MCVCVGGVHKFTQIVRGEIRSWRDVLKSGSYAEREARENGVLELDKAH